MACEPTLWIRNGMSMVMVMVMAFGQSRPCERDFQAGLQWLVRAHLTCTEYQNRTIPFAWWPYLAG
jgi:hypothetical protein